MTLFTVVPAKPFSQSKTRLSPLLSLEQRVTLSRSLFLRTVKLAKQVGDVVVVSRDRTVRQLAKQSGAWSLVEAGDTLNVAIAQAIEWVTARGGQTALILPTDLPLLTFADLREVVNLGDTPPCVVIAPCHRGDGTNALLLSPPNKINVMFGQNSFNKHQQAALAAGVEPLIYRSPTIAFDLDLPEDVEALERKLSL